MLKTSMELAVDGIKCKRIWISCKSREFYSNG